METDIRSCEELSYYYEIQPFMEKISTPKYLNKQILIGQNKGYSNFRINLTKAERTYPNICVPIAGAIDFYRTRRVNFDFVVEEKKNSYLQHTSFHTPLIVEDLIGKRELSSPLDKVWRFSTSEGVCKLVDAYVSAIRESDEVAKGVLDSLEWCINETMDNVLQHSSAPYGFVMGQIQKETKRLSICIFDWGRGIYNTLKESKHKPTKALDAITLALQERVTRDEKIGQGNGMWGLSEVIKGNNGFVRVSSSGASYTYSNEEVTTIANGEMNFGDQQGSTFVDFQLDYRKAIDFEKALGGYEPVNLWLEERELDNGEYQIVVSEQAHGTGTRQSAMKLRNSILNIFHEKHQRITLDFSGVNLVSSSFADELLTHQINNGQTKQRSK